jgi:NADPH2:quinone reductase
MRAAVVHEYGPPENVTIAEVPLPEVGPEDVLVQVEAASVNFPDLLLVSGGYQVTLPLPFVPGSDLAGTVAEVGAKVTGFAPGDRVSGTTMRGAFAEYALLDQRSVRALPDGVDPAAAAAFWVVYSTAYHSLHSVARLRGDERVLVLGAAGGVGLATVDLGVLHGAEVVAVATGAAKLDLCRERGAAVTIDLATDDLRARLKEIGGVDVVIDAVGGPATEQALRGMRPGGRLVTVGYASGEIPRIPLNLVLLKGVSILGFEMRTFGVRFPAEVARADRELAALLAGGRLRPYLGARFPLAKTAAALRLVADRGALGKVIVDVR